MSLTNTYYKENAKQFLGFGPSVGMNSPQCRNRPRRRGRTIAVTAIAAIVIVNEAALAEGFLSAGGACPHRSGSCGIASPNALLERGAPATAPSLRSLHLLLGGGDASTAGGSDVGSRRRHDKDAQGAARGGWWCSFGSFGRRGSGSSGDRSGGSAAGSSLAAAASGVGRDLGAALAGNAALLSAAEKAMAEQLLELRQEHLFQAWPAPGTRDDDKRRLLRQAIELDGKYPGGIRAYVTKARRLLRESAEGVNPFEGFTPAVPNGESLKFGTLEFEAAEAAGLEAAAKTAFVLVAGGLGERLGYQGIKLALPAEVTTRQSYLELYVKHILALQQRCRAAAAAAGTTSPEVTLPLIIMTSADTDSQTRELLRANDNFGMTEGQVIIIMQDKVPALGDVDAKLVFTEEDPFELDTKPHGHGDVHHLLHREGIAARLRSKGFEWLFFFQDTNALVLNSLLPALGVSAAAGYDMNSICVPRMAQEAAGAITALRHTDKSRSDLIINVEYNQLDPLLRATVSPAGDVNDPATGCSPYPGNTNNIVMKLSSYCRVLAGEDEGVVVEFVNPKYKDSSRTTFKKPTRLECMMQDFPKLLAKELGGNANIGFTSFDKWLTFSPAKNSLEAGAAGSSSGVPPGTASSAEADFYAQFARRMSEISGCSVGPAEAVEFGGVKLSMGPRIVLSPKFAVCTEDLRQKIGREVQLSSRSTLVVDGADVRLEAMDIDGAVVIKAVDGARVAVRGLKVRNAGWEMAPIVNPAAAAEEDRVRGYVINKKETSTISVNRPGNFLVGVNGDVTEVNFDVLEPQ